MFNKALRDEWRTHGSKFAIAWLANMQQQGRVIDMTSDAFATIRRSIGARPLDTQGRNAILKDFHLVSAALAHDKTLLSYDLGLKTYLFIYSAQYDALGEIMWVSPLVFDLPIWIKGGAIWRNDWTVGEMEVD